MKLPLLTLLILLISFLTVNADFTITQSCANENALMKLSDISDAHVQPWNAEDYPYSLCNSETPLGNVHTCTGNNRILQTSPSLDYHTSRVDSPDSVDICYSDYSCIQANACSSNEFCVVKLSDSEEAHLYPCDYPDAPLSLCCTSTSDPSSSTPSPTSLSGTSSGGSGRSARLTTDGRLLSKCESNPNDPSCTQIATAQSPSQLSGTEDYKTIPYPEQDSSSLTPFENSETFAKKSSFWIIFLVIFIALLILGTILYFIKFRQKPPVETNITTP